MALLMAVLIINTTSLIIYMDIISEVEFIISGDCHFKDL